MRTFQDAYNAGGQGRLHVQIMSGGTVCTPATLFRLEWKATVLPFIRKLKFQGGVPEAALSFTQMAFGQFREQVRPIHSPPKCRSHPDLSETRVPGGSLLNISAVVGVSCRRFAPLGRVHRAAYCSEAFLSQQRTSGDRDGGTIDKPRSMEHKAGFERRREE